jgi:hypothetical protein
MSVDQRIREGLRMTNRALPEPDINQALESVTSYTRRRLIRRRLVLAAGSAAAVAAVAVAVVAPRLLDDDRNSSPVTGPAAQVIADGTVVSYGAGTSGSVLTVWRACDDPAEENCRFAWLLSTGGQPQAAGMLSSRDAAPDVYAGGDAFVVQKDNGADGKVVAADGTSEPIRQDCSDESWPTGLQSGRYVLVRGLLGADLVDTRTGTTCDAPTLDGGRSLRAGVIASDGTVWGLIDSGAKRWAQVAWYDGVQWRYHALVGIRNSGDSGLAVSGSEVAVLHGANNSVVRGLSGTIDGGATWFGASAADLPFRAYDSMAFAAPSELYVADDKGNLWRSADDSLFSRVATPGPVSGLMPAGDAVIARIGSADENKLVRISAQGTVQTLVVR